MRKIVMAMVFAISILAIIAGKLHWNQKIETIASSSKEQLLGVSEQRGDSQQNGSDSPAIDRDNLVERLIHFPEDAATTIIDTIEQGESVSIVAMGSKATAAGEGTWTDLLQQQLNEAYGSDTFELIVKSFGDDLSIDVTQQQKYTEVANLEPDILLLEPFLLNDNGRVAIDNSLESTSTIIQAVKDASEDVIIMLQPPNPIHNAVYYPAQVNALQQYAEENNIIYLDHWTNWPEQTSDEILDYLNEEDSSPNAEGHRVWAEYVANYFTGE